jgi:aldehyde dehydrogenase (NAD+)
MFYWQNYHRRRMGRWRRGPDRRDRSGYRRRLAEQALGDASDVDRAVAAARRCHQAARCRAQADRARAAWCRRWGVICFAQGRDRAVLTLEQGKPLWEAISRSRARRFTSSITATRPSTVEGRSIPLGAGYFDFTVRALRRLGADHPLELSAGDDRALAVGSAGHRQCLRDQTPELDPLTNAFIARAAEAVGLPKGRGQHALRAGAMRPARALRASRRQPDRLHRLGAHRASPLPERPRKCGALRAGTGRQVRGHRSC